MAKTPEYTREAIRKYESKFEKKSVNFPKGTTERVKEMTNKTFGAYVVDLVLTDLERLERKASKSTQSIETHLYAPCDNAQRQDISNEDWSVGGRFKYNWIGKELTKEEIDQLSQEERNDYYSYLAYLEMGQQAYDARVREDLESRKKLQELLDWELQHDQMLNDQENGNV